MTPINQPTPPPPKPGTVEFTNGTITLGFGLGVVPYWYLKTPTGRTEMQALDHTLIAALRRLQQCSSQAEHGTDCPCAWCRVDRDNAGRNKDLGESQL